MKLELGEHVFVEPGFPGKSWVRVPADAGQQKLIHVNLNGTTRLSKTRIRFLPWFVYQQYAWASVWLRETAKKIGDARQVLVNVDDLTLFES